jgi:hypothetical protein
MAVSVACISAMVRWSINYVLEGRSKEKVVGRHFWYNQGKPREIRLSIIEVQTRSNEICTSLAYSE